MVFPLIHGIYAFQTPRNSEQWSFNFNPRKHMTDENTSKPEDETPEAAAPDTAAESTESTPPPAAEEPAIEPETLPNGESAKMGDRVLATLLDYVVASVLSAVPFLGIAYLLTRDALPFLDGQSVGKKVMKLRAVNAETGKPLTNDWGSSCMRNIPIAIAPLALVELFIMNGKPDHQRLGDDWGKTRVIVEK
jgi:uncharacterized RDD family membrane protein YckC